MPLILLALLINTHLKRLNIVQIDMARKVFHEAGQLYELNTNAYAIPAWYGEYSELFFVGKGTNLPLEENVRYPEDFSSKRSLSDRGKKTVNIALEQAYSTFMHYDSSVKVTKQAQPCQDGDKRRKIIDLLQKDISPDEYPLVEGILLGGSSQLTKQQKDQVKIVGLSHVLSASGSNVSLFLILNAPFLWKRFGKFFTGFIIGSLVLGYLEVAGCSAPLLRAAISTGLAISGVALLQQVTTLWVLAITCGAMILFQPFFITDVGFQLSVAATIGIVFASKTLPKRTSKGIDTSRIYITNLNYQSNVLTANLALLRNRFEVITKSIINSCKEVVILTGAAQLATLPIAVYYFKEVSLSAVVSNTAVLWVVPIILYGAVSTVVFNLLHLHIFAVLSGGLTSFCAHFFLWVITVLSQFTFAFVSLSDLTANCILFIYFISILIYLIKLNRKKKHRHEVFLLHTQ